MFNFVLFFIFGFNLASSLPDPFFRKDYTYVSQYDAFYKVHWETSGLSWSSAFLACDDEESLIFYPKMEGEWTVVKNLLSEMQLTPNVSDSFVGMHYAVNLGEFITVDGDGILNPSPIVNENGSPNEDYAGSCVTMDIHDGTYKLHDCSGNPNTVQLFVCRKKVLVEQCPTVDLGYEYVKEIRKCYKIHEKKRKTWKKAMETCFVEGGYLAIVKNSVEAEILRNKLSLHNVDYFVGFRRVVPNSDLYTVKGHRFDNTSYIRWNHNVTFDTKDDCGVIYQFHGDLKTMTKSCNEVSPFVCEMPSKSYSLSVFKSQLSQVCDETESMMLEHNIMDSVNEAILAT